LAHQDDRGVGTQDATGKGFGENSQPTFHVVDVVIGFVVRPQASVSGGRKVRRVALEK
jgi:hypothetical protein